MKATERRGFEEVLELLPSARQRASTILLRVKKIRPLEAGADILDVGAAHGAFVAARNEAGYSCRGIDPWGAARDNARRLSSHLKLPVIVAPGTAEAIPFPDGSFDLVHAASVIEHVSDAQTAFAEAFRVLRPGGVFWFSSVSSLCPRQTEIRGFPLFGWYPDPAKRRIMAWAKNHRPSLIGHTDTPALHWFTPWKARAMLETAGFKRVFDRWELRREDEGGAAYRGVLRLIQSGWLTKLAADVVVRDCSFAALKERHGP